MARTGLSLREHLAQLQALADNPRSLDPEEACDLIGEMRGDLTSLRQQADGLVRLPPLLGWVPRIGGDLEAVPHLLIVADGLTEAGVLGCDAMRPVLQGLGEMDDATTGLSPEQVIRLLSDEQASLDQARTAVDRPWTRTSRGTTVRARRSPWIRALASNTRAATCPPSGASTPARIRRGLRPRTRSGASSLDLFYSGWRSLFFLGFLGWWTCS